MVIRRFKENDIDSIIQLFHDTVRNINIKDYSKEQVDTWAPKNADKDSWLKRLSQNITCVCENDGVITGFGVLKASGYIDTFYVHMDYQGQGIGALILDKLEEDAVRLGIKDLETDASITAKGFFESKGYRIVKEQRMECSNMYFTNYKMKKILERTV